MELLRALLQAFGGVLAILLLWLVLEMIYYDVTRTKIPPEFHHPLKLRILYWVFIMALIVVSSPVSESQGGQGIWGSENGMGSHERRTHKVLELWGTRLNK